MEALLRLLPGPQPIIIRYGATALMVLVALAVRYYCHAYTGRYGFLPFILPIVASALLFDRGTGIFATILSALCVAGFLDWNVDVPVYIGALLMFFVVSGCLVFIAEGLHKALVAAHNAQRATDLLLQEMSHRVKNKFAMVSSIISLQARQSSPEVQRALKDISTRVNVIANVHNFLQLSRHEGLIDMSEYLPALCRSLRDAVGPQNIFVTTSAPKLELPPEKALAAGVIVNELVTNAFKYAFTDKGVGHVRVNLTREPDGLVLSVADDGTGFTGERKEGLGTRLVTLFADQLGGAAEWTRCDPHGCLATIRFPA
jgi:two-component sensor histidine kinase